MEIDGRRRVGRETKMLRGRRHEGTGLGQRRRNRVNAAGRHLRGPSYWSQKLSAWVLRGTPEQTGVSAKWVQVQPLLAPRTVLSR